MSLDEPSDGLYFVLQAAEGIWVWGLTFVVAAVSVVVFNTLYAAGMLAQGDVRSLQFVVFILGLIATVGLTLRLVLNARDILAVLNAEGESQ